jgi:transposase
MSSAEEVKSLSREDLLALVAQLQQQVVDLTATVEELRAENSHLQRGAKRQAAPFSRGTRTRQPKRPGRKPGQGTFSFRQAPSPEEITEPPVDVPVILEACPGCGGQLEKGAGGLRLRY